MAGEKYAVDGALVHCTGCPAPSFVKATHNQTVKYQDKNVCNELDKNSANIKFSSCVFAKTCNPSLTAWNNPDSRATASKAKALLDNATIPCLKGGIVSFHIPANVGQELNNESFNKLLKKLYKEIWKESIYEAKSIIEELKELSKDLGKQLSEAKSSFESAIKDAAEAAENYVGAGPESKAMAGAFHSDKLNAVKSIKNTIEGLEDSIGNTENTLRNSVDGLEKLEFGKKLLGGAFALPDSIEVLQAKNDKEIMSKLLPAAAGTAIGLLLAATPAGWLIVGTGAVITSLGTEQLFEKGIEALEKRGVKFQKSTWKDAFSSKSLGR